ncbi:AI-2E family transporter [Candidatus Giovannonibacteria bacterium]|nr:AI-2E family transporter [Candidatus Giovannonibacteria bacterium]
MEKRTLEISNGTIIRFFLILIAFWALYQLSEVIAIILMSVVIASAIEPAARWLKNYRIPRVWGVLVIYLVSFAFLGVMFYLVVPPLLSESVDFLVNLPNYLKSANINSTIPFWPNLPLDISGFLSNYVSDFEASLGKATGSFLQAASGIFGGALSFVLIIVISFYLAVQERGIENFLRIVTPKDYEPYILDLWSRTRRKIGWWLQGQLLLSVLVGVLVFLGLSILGVKYALSLAILSALFEIIPIFGPVMAAIPAVAIAFVQKPVLALSVLILYVIVQQFENHLIYPLVVRKTIGIPPLLVIIGLLIGGTLGGFFGLLLSVPIATVLVEIITDIARKKEIEL